MNKGKIKKRVVLIISAVILLAVILILCFSCKKKDTDKPEREVHTLTTDNISTGDTVTDDTGEKTSTNEADSSSSENSGTSRLTVEVGSATATTEISTKTMDAESSTDKSTRSTTEMTTRSSTEKTTRVTTRSTTESTTERTTEPSTEKTTKTTTESTTERTTESTTEKTTRVTTEKTTESTSESTTEETTQHTHNYKHAPAYDNPATCSEDGVKVYLCDCGASKTEVIKATGKHNWVWKTHTETVHHEAVTHTEYVYNDGWTEYFYVYRYHCAVCDKLYEDYEDYHNNDHCHGGYSEKKVLDHTVEHEPEIIDSYEYVDTPAYDEEVEVKDYEYCSYCGKKK